MKKFRCTIYLEHGFGKSGDGYIIMNDDSIEIFNYWSKKTRILEFTDIQLIVLGGLFGIKIFYGDNPSRVITVQVLHQKEISTLALDHNVIIEHRGLLAFIKKRKCLLFGLIDYFRYYLIA